MQKIGIENSVLISSPQCFAPSQVCSKRKRIGTRRLWLLLKRTIELSNTLKREDLSPRFTINVYFQTLWSYEMHKQDPNGFPQALHHLSTPPMLSWSRAYAHRNPTMDMLHYRVY